MEVMGRMVGPSRWGFKMKIKLALAALLVLGTATAADAKHYRVSLDGYCDGWDFTVDKSTGLAVGTPLYANCGAYTDGAMAGVNGKFAGGKTASMGDESYYVNFAYT